MIAKGKSISHGSKAIDYAINKKESQEICRNELYGMSGNEMMQEMKPYLADHPNIKNEVIRFEVSPTADESEKYTSDDWKKLSNEFMHKMGLEKHQSITVLHKDKENSHLHIVVNRVSLEGQIKNDSYIGYKSTEVANKIAQERGYKQAKDIAKDNKLKLQGEFKKVFEEMKSFSFSELKQKLKQKSIELKESINSKGNIFGYRVCKEGMKEYKASEVSKKLTVKNIENTFNQVKRDQAININIENRQNRNHGRGR